MLTYTPPLQELHFLLHEQLNAAAILAELPRYADVELDLIEQVAEEIGRFAREQVLPLNRDADLIGCHWHNGEVAMPPGFPAAYAAYRDLGWPTLCASAEEGGQGLPRLAFSAVGEALAAASHAFTMFSAINHCAAACLRASADERLIAQWLPKLVSGEVLASMCLTEPQAGSDLGLLRTRAVPDGDGYRISGTKIFASGAEHDLTENILHLVLARLPDAPVGTRGLSLFLVPKHLPDGRRNEVHCDGIEHKMGLHGSPTCTLRFEDAQGWMIGQPHQGLAAMFPMMNEARLLSGLQALGMSEIAFQNALAYAKERRQGRAPGGENPSPLIAHPDVQRMLMIQKAWTEGGRMLVNWTALLIDVADWHPDAARRRETAELVGLLTPIVKGFLTENAQQSISLALQIHGGHGYVAETGIEQLARDVRVTTIYEGTTGIQARDLLLRKMLGQDGHRFAVLAAPIDAWLAEAEADAALQEFCTPLGKLRDQTYSMTELLATREREREGAVLPACNHYLRLVGHLVLAWLWAQAGEAAQKQAKAGSVWHQAKLDTARFHFRQMLPEVAQLLEAIELGDMDMAAALGVHP